MISQHTVVQNFLQSALAFVIQNLSSLISTTKPHFEYTENEACNGSDNQPIFPGAFIDYLH